MDKPVEIGTQEMDAILKSLPIFERADFSPGKWEGGESRVENGGTVMSMPYFSFSNELNDFRQALYDNGWVFSFDWPAWQDEARKLVDAGGLETADVETLRKLLTLLCRKERFCEGTLAGAFEEGLIVSILKRLREIRDSRYQA